MENFIKILQFTKNAFIRILSKSNRDANVFLWGGIYSINAISMPVTTF